MPKVSVIVPNYNHGPYLRQRIESILAQTYKDFELILLDDCSADNSRQVLDAYKHHPKVSQVVYNKTNSGGPFKQWKKGIEMAAGEYVWIAESDDWCEDTLLQTLVDGLGANPNCVMAYCQTYTVNDNQIVQVSQHDKLQEYIPGTTYIKQYLADSCSIWNASSLVFRRRFFDNVSATFTNYKMSGDWLFYIEMARQGDVFISGKVLNYFRNHDKDVSGKMYQTGDNYLEELQVLKFLKSNKLITGQEFKQHLLTKYIRFRVFSYRFTADVKEAIKASFYNDEGRSYQWFLQTNGRFSLFKIRVNRRLGMLLK